jgi:hypothetical protein
MKKAVLHLKRSIIPDLLDFNNWEYFGLLIFAGCSIVFSFISFDHFYNPNDYPSVFSIVNDRQNGIYS